MPLHSDSLRLHLGRGPATPRSLQERLGLSQPTLSRALGRLADDVVRLGAARSIQYLLRDRSRGFADLPVYRVDADGRIRCLGLLIPVRPEGYVMQQDDGQLLHSEGIPWWLLDMRPLLPVLAECAGGRVRRQRPGPLARAGRAPGQSARGGHRGRQDYPGAVCIRPVRSILTRRRWAIADVMCQGAD